MINLKKMRLFGVAILLFQFIFAMGHVAFADSSNRVTTIAENANLRKTPADLLALLGSYMEKRDIKGVMSIHETDAAMVEFGGGIARGLDDIRRVYVEFFESEPVLKVNARQIVEAAGIAIILGDYTLDYKNALGNTVSVEGKFGDMVRQQEDGTWLYVLDNPYAP